MSVSLVAWVESAAPRTLRRALFLAIFAILWGLITHGTYAGTGDEPHYAMIAHSLVFDQDLDLANDYADRANLIFGGALEPGSHAIPGKDRRLRPVHDVGLPLALSPCFWAAYWAADHLTQRLPARLLERARLSKTLVLRHLMSFAMIALTGVLAILVFDLCVHLTAHKARAFFWALLCTLSPPLLSHSFLFFTEIPSALLALAAYRLLTLESDLSAFRYAAIGVLSAYLFLLHVRNVGLVAVLVTLALLRIARGPERPWRLCLLSTGFAAILLLRTWINFFFWGTLLTSPHAHIEAGLPVGPMLVELATRLWGWLFDQAHGLLPFAPLYLLSLPGFLCAWRRSRRVFVELAALVLVYVLVMAIPALNPRGWTGGWAPAARYLVPITPFLAVAAFFSVGGLRRLTLPVTALLVIQGVLDAFFWQHPKLLWNDDSGPSLFLVWVGERTGIDLARLLPAAPLSVATVLVTAAFLGLWVVAARLLVKETVPPQGY